jgi:hypothetical protein
MLDHPKCDGSFQDCRTESGFVCETGSTDDNCELDEEEPLVIDSFLLMFSIEVTIFSYSSFVKVTLPFLRSFGV